MYDAGGAAGPPPERPNIVFVCSDQHSYRYTGYAGHDYVETPHLDRIARQGTVFANAYCGSPVCALDRASGSNVSPSGLAGREEEVAM